MKIKAITLILSVFCVSLFTTGCADDEAAGKPPVIDQPATTNPPATTGGTTGGTGGTGGTTGGTGGTTGGTGGTTGGTGGTTGGTGGTTGGTGGGGGGGGTGGFSCAFLPSLVEGTFATTSPAGEYEGQTFASSTDIISGFSFYVYGPSHIYYGSDYLEARVARRGGGAPITIYIKNSSLINEQALAAATPTNPVCITNSYQPVNFTLWHNEIQSGDLIYALALDVRAGADWATTDSGRAASISFFYDGQRTGIIVSTSDILKRDGVTVDTVQIQGMVTRRVLIYHLN